MALEHGGQLQQIAKRYNIAAEQWLDLSTGISPISYPIPDIPSKVWQQLPEVSSELIAAANDYYGANNIVATSGSQSVISKLPLLFASQHANKVTVWLPQVGYKEHEKAWREQGFSIVHYSSLPEPEQLTATCIVVVINPNNPTGQLYSRKTLSLLLNKIHTLGGWLIVDEAFMDVIPAGQSMIDLTTSSAHLFVLRSVGKFFGLAGGRLGFFSADKHWMQLFADLSNPWEVNGPAQFVAQCALRDSQWQQQQLLQLKQWSSTLENLLLSTFKQPISGTLLFKTVALANAEWVFDFLCQQGVYVRLCDEKNALRFGIPTGQEMLKLTTALANLSNHHVAKC